MNTKNLLKYFMAAVAVCIFLTACKKKSDPPAVVDKDTSGASESALSMGYSDDIGNISDQGTAGGLSSYLSPNNNSGERGMMGFCTTVYVSPITQVSSKWTFYVDFGTTACLCGDGRYRSGKVNVSYSGAGTALYAYRDSSEINKHTITFDNYYVNGNHVEGTQIIINNGHNAAHHLNYTVKVIGGKITLAGGGVVLSESNRTRELIDAGGPNWGDEIYSITGSASGTYSNGTTYTENITSPLKIHTECNEFKIESGILALTPYGKPTRSINFGTDGVCDHYATVTINGQTYNITL